MISNLMMGQTESLQTILRTLPYGWVQAMVTVAVAIFAIASIAAWFLATELHQGTEASDSWHGHVDGASSHNS